MVIRLLKTVRKGGITTWMLDPGQERTGRLRIKEEILQKILGLFDLGKTKTKNVIFTCTSKPNCPLSSSSQNQ
jgi:hypothetical protein